MKKIVLLMVIGMVLFSGMVFAQTTQGANTTTRQQQQQQGDSGEYYTGGGYTGPLLGVSAIEDLLSARPNQWVKVEGYLIGKRVDGSFILADAAEDFTSSVVVYIHEYVWANLEIAPDTHVIVYGIVNRSELRTEIEARRIEIQ